MLLAAVEMAGCLSRAEALRIVPDYVIDDAVTDKRLVVLFPGVYATPNGADSRRVRRLGALVYRPNGALSHVDALDEWGLPSGLDHATHAPVHATVPHGESHIRWDGLELHRRRGFIAESPAVRMRNGLALVRLEQAVVESWALLDPMERRAPAIVAVRDRKTTASRLMRTLERQPRTPGAGEMRRLFRLLALGVHSELEAWGHENVFVDSRFPAARCQVPTRLPTGRMVYLDRYYEDELVDVELDGAAYHGKPGQRERDIRRDAAVAVLGIQTVRFSHPRLFREPEDCREELLSILATRRRQLGLRDA